MNKKIEELEAENKQLREEIQELKKEKDSSPEYQFYLNQKEDELKSRQLRLEQLKNIVNDLQGSEATTTPDNGRGLGLVAIGVVVVCVGLLCFVLLYSKKGKLKKK